MNRVRDPHPTGSYKVGTLVFSAVDDSRKAMFGPSAGTEPRKITGRLYYPVLASDAEGHPHAQIMSRNKAEALAKSFYMKCDYDNEVAAGTYDGDFYEDVSPVPGEEFPLIIFDHGLGSYVESNNLMCTELCSHGYVVAALGHAYEAIETDYEDQSYDLMDKTIAKRQYEPRIRGTIAALKLMVNKKGTYEEQYERLRMLQEKYAGLLLKILEQRVLDVKFMMSEIERRFSDRIDFSKGIGITGHSMGGIVAYYLCQTDNRFVCGINIDGMLIGDYSGMTMKKPFYQISCEDNRGVVSKVMLDTEAPVYWSLFRNMKHLGFGDMIFKVPVKALVGKMDPLKMHEYLCRIHLSFMGRYLKGTGEEVYNPDDEYVADLIARQGGAANA
ncbi:Platelet-activating factor acetylhydrolase, isoform II [Ruminococcaceae bacterium YRB3002]|nr:Platelet-activating factor acetylhydrolase, isoform II [Ruminococcaceae bacterium YRB3002]